MTRITNDEFEISRLNFSICANRDWVPLRWDLRSSTFQNYLAPADYWWGFFSLSGILADFILQATLFTALLAIDARRYCPCYYFAHQETKLVKMVTLKYLRKNPKPCFSFLTARKNYCFKGRLFLFTLTEWVILWKTRDFKRAQSRYFELFLATYKITFKWRKPENNSLTR